MKGDILYKILDTLEDKAMETSDFFEVMLGAGYGASLGEFDKKYRRLEEARHDYQINRENKRRLQVYISKLKKDGLVSETSSGEIYLSQNGKRKLKNFNSDKSHHVFNYKKEPGDKIIIISYDIPVLFNRERRILRDILKMLGFNLIHKSVWIGKVKLPENFIKDVEKMGVEDYIEIIEVANEGTLKYKR